MRKKCCKCHKIKTRAGEGHLLAKKVAIDIVSKVSKRVVSWGETPHTGPGTIFVKVTQIAGLWLIAGE